MITKLYTVVWTITIEKKIPQSMESLGAEQLEDFTQPKEIQDFASQIIEDASLELNWKDGIITSVDDK